MPRLADEIAERGLAADRVEIGVLGRHRPELLVEVDRGSQMLDGIARPPGQALAAREVVQQCGMLGMFGDQRSTAVRHLGVLARLVERLQRRPHLVARDARRQVEPLVAPRPVARLGRRRELRVCEGPDRDHHQVVLIGLRVEHGPAALRAEMEDVHLAVLLVRRPGVVDIAAGDLHLAGPEPRLHAEGAARPPLARQAVADRDHERVTLRGNAKLPTATGCVSAGHRRIIGEESAAAGRTQPGST